MKGNEVVKDYLDKALFLVNKNVFAYFHRLKECIQIALKEMLIFPGNLDCFKT